MGISYIRHVFVVLLLIGANGVFAQDWRQQLTTADSLSKAKNQDSAIVLGNLALRNVIDERGPLDTVTASVYGMLARYYYRDQDYSAAESTYQKALTIQEDAFGPYHTNVVETIMNLGVLYAQTTRYDTAETLFLKCLKAVEYAQGQDALDAVDILNPLGLMYYSRSEYGKAESIYKRALRIEEAHGGAETATACRLLLNLGNVYFSELRNSEADNYFEQAQNIAAKVWGPKSPRTATVMVSRASLLLYRIKDYDRAESLYNAGCVIYEDSNNTDDRNYGKILNNLARLHDLKGEYREADSLTARALEVMETAYGAIDSDVRNMLNIQALIRRHMGDYDSAETLYDKVLSIDRKAAGAENEDRALMYELIGQLKCLEHDYVSGIDYALRGFTIRQKKFDDIIRTLSERDALGYAVRFRTSVDNYISCFLRVPQERRPPAELLTDIVLSAKGRVTECAYERQELSEEENDSLLRSMIDSMQTIKSSLSRLFVQGPGSVPEEFRARADSLQRAADALEAGLLDRSPSYKRRFESRNVTAHSISDKLSKNSALVEYFRYDYQLLQPDSTVSHYLVVGLTKSAAPVVFDLGPASQIDSLVSRYRRHMLRLAANGSKATNTDQDEYRQIGTALYERVWKPIERYTDGDSLVFVAPDGALNLIAFGGMIDGGGKYVVEKCAIHYLSSGRDFIRLYDNEKTGMGLLAMGDPDFDARPEARLLGASPNPPMSETGKTRVRNYRSRCEDLSAVLLNPLPDTRKEIEAVARRWNDRWHERASVYFGPAASEEHFKTEAPGKRVIHVATHGYFLEERCQPDLPNKALSTFLGAVGESPLLLSGLFLSGANLHGEGADSAGAEDGILTAYEVSGMNLKGTQLVVLSACETALGEVKAGEGVYGLRRAFQMAGARTVVSALWPVSDQITADMMSSLYGSRQESLPEVFRRMQLLKISELRSKGMPDHPYTWGAFIATGDWR